jgi:hypothetical protein
MNTTARFEIAPLGLSLSSFLAVTYILCVLYGLIVSDVGMHQLLAAMLPGFTWINWTSFLIGLIWSVAFGWYVAVVFAPLFNFFNARAAAR